MNMCQDIQYSWPYIDQCKEDVNIFEEGSESIMSICGIFILLLVVLFGKVAGICLLSVIGK